MVLGVLSVMVIMAVAFAIAMRTERVAAGNYADSVRARQLVHVGLARALNDLAGKLGTNGLGSIAGGTNYPPWAVTNSYNTTYTNTSTNAYLLQLLALTRENEATNFVPRALWAASTNADYQNASNHWLPVDSIVSNTSGTNTSINTNRMGRVKYLILNCSGLLDANFAGGAARGVGTNPMEIAVNQLGELPGTFTNQRNTDVRYETLNELAVLNNFQSTNFTVYSHALPGYWSNNVTPSLSQVVTQVNLSGGYAEVGSRNSKILDALAEIGFVNPDRGIIFRNLLDYVDTNSVPEDYITSVEAVPMINEMVFSNKVDHVTAPSEVWNVTCGVSFELWYPFVSGGGNFQFAATVSFIPKTAGLPAVVCNITNFIFSVSSINSFAVIPCLGSSVPPYSSDPGKFDIRIDNCMVYSGTETYDNLLNSCIVFSDVDQGVTKAMQCLDPRFNQNPDFAGALWKEESESVSSLHSVNDWTSSYLASPTNTGDTNTEMYVANRPLQSVAELGYLVYSSNAPWHTIKLYGTNLHRVLDVFGLSTNTSAFITNTAYHGLVNPNSKESNALAAAFADMPVDEYSGGPSNRLSMASALMIAGNLYNGGFYTNLSDIGRNFTAFPSTATNELQKESFFRNTIGLLSVRQNLFTIIIEAQVASGGNIPRNPVRQRAVALVWRDPYTGEMFVRSIKWLRD